MSKRRGLGRGLSALIPESQMPADAAGLLTIPVTDIAPNPHQPRSYMDEEKLEELAASIREHGLIQPLIVNEVSPGKYHLIAGERRWRACQRAGVEQVPVVVKQATDQAMLELAIIENVQRADLNQVEEALAYRQLMDEFGMTQEQVAQRMGKSRPAIANVVRLLTLPAEIQEAVVLSTISGGHARCLITLPSEAEQISVYKSIVKFGWNVRQTEEHVRKRLTKQAVPRGSATPRLSPEMKDLEKQFRGSLGTKVKLEPSSSGDGGKLVIEYFSDEELQHIYEMIVRKQS